MPSKIARDMKRLLYFLSFTTALVVSGCEKVNFADRQELVVPDGEMAVNLSVLCPDDPATRSYVSGTESPIRAGSIQMLCFDLNGKFLAKREPTVAPATSTTGKITGSVPNNTARIHFLANFNPDLGSMGVGTMESVMMKSEALSRSKTDAISYWGFHAEASTSAMQDYLTASTPNTVILIRDRAKVTLVNNTPNTGIKITSLRWCISNGLQKGFVAATSAVLGSVAPYTNDYTDESKRLITEYRTSNTYSLAEGNLEEDTEQQFLFENGNPSLSPLRIIVEAVYSNGQTRYHAISLENDDHTTLQIKRNNNYTITLTKLPYAENLGVSSFAEALTTTNFSNNPFAQVSMEVNEVGTDTKKLSLAPDKLSQIRHQEDKVTDEKKMVVVNFKYTNAAGTAGISGLSTSNFKAQWEIKADDDESPNVAKSLIAQPTIASYDPNTGKGTIEFEMNDVTSALANNSFELVASDSGLRRTITIYSISKFTFKAEPSLERDGTHSRSVSGNTLNTYKLTFKLDDSYPEELYPLTIRIASANLYPFSDIDHSTVTSGKFSVSVTSTADLTPTSTSTSAWNYQATSWNKWYEYVVETKTVDKEYTIYLSDMSASLASRPNINTVGLFFSVEGYGPVVPLDRAR